MRTPDLAEMFSVSNRPPIANPLFEQIGVDASGHVRLVHRDEDGDTVSTHSWASSTDAARAVHAMVVWLDRGAPGAFTY